MCESEIDFKRCPYVVYGMITVNGGERHGRNKLIDLKTQNFLTGKTVRKENNNRLTIRAKKKQTNSVEKQLKETSVPRTTRKTFGG